MKRFLMIVGALGVIIMLFLASVEFWVRSIPNEYSYKYKYLENHVQEIRILNVGSSIGRSGINPYFFSDKAFNVANVSQDIETDCSIINKYLDRADSLKMVIFALLPGSFCSRMGEGIENWRLRKYHIYMDLDCEKPVWKEWLEINNISAVIPQIVKSLRNINTVECDKLGQGLDSLVESNAVKLSQGISASSLHNRDYSRANYTIIIPKVRSTIQACKKKGIKVLFVLLPAYITYTSRIDKRMLMECDSIAASLSSEYSNVSYLNLFTSQDFCSDDFRNSNHLSRAGAIKLTTMLNNYIMKNE